MRSFLLGISVIVVLLAAFISGAVADRLFVVKPAGFFSNRLSSSSDKSGSSPLVGSFAFEDGVIDVSDIAESASPSVVTISVKRTERYYEASRRQFFFEMPLEIREEEVQQDIGTGFVVTEDGLVVTNKHVVGEIGAEYTVIDTEGNEHTVEKIYRDPTNDLAILQVAELQVSPLVLGDSSTLRVGEPAIAIGTALGEFRHTVTTGIVSGLGRGITAGDALSGQFESLEGVIQTDAAINPGNSGGPLLNKKGEVIGVNVAVSAGAENIGFALPINVIKSSLDNFNQTGQFDRPFLGVQYQPISETAALLNEVPQGLLVIEVVENSAAEEAGIIPGDILLKFDGQELLESTSLTEVINKKSVGDTVPVELWSDGNKREVKITLKIAE